MGKTCGSEPIGDFNGGTFDSDFIGRTFGSTTLTGSDSIGSTYGSDCISRRTCGGGGESDSIGCVFGSEFIGRTFGSEGLLDSDSIGSTCDSEQIGGDSMGSTFGSEALADCGDGLTISRIGALGAFLLPFSLLFSCIARSCGRHHQLGL
jgi:hypothetical protein